MSSNTQYNTERTTGTTGNTASTGNTTGLRTTERLGTQSGTNTEKPIGYDSFPLAHDYGTTTTSTAQHDTSRVGEEGLKHHGHGLGTGLGHHKSHTQEGTYVGQDTGTAQQAYTGGTGYTTTGTGVGTDNQYSTTGHPTHHHHGGGDMKTTTDTPLRPAEQTYPASGVTGTGYATTTTSGTGQYPTGTGTTGQHGESFPSHHKHHIGGVHGQEVTDPSVKPTMADKIVGGAEKVAGKVTDNTAMYQKGAERAAGETAKKPYA